ncbi:MAG: hypothetical protein ABIN61_06400, partial [candidate division WOR-3 bacterium]
LKYGKEIFLHYDYNGNYLGEVKEPEGIVEERIRMPDGREKIIWSEKPIRIFGEYYTFKKEGNKYKVKLDNKEYYLPEGLDIGELKGELRFNKKKQTLELWKLEYRGELDSLGYGDLCIIRSDIKLKEVDTKKN